MFYLEIKSFILISSLILLVSPVQAANWEKVITIDGSSTTKTDPFEIGGSEWRIDWVYEPEQDFAEDWAAFGFFVYDQNTDMYEARVLKKGQNELGGTIYMHNGPGHYYLLIDVASVDHFLITVYYDVSSVPSNEWVMFLGAILFLIALIVLAGVGYTMKLTKKGFKQRLSSPRQIRTLSRK